MVGTNLGVPEVPAQHRRGMGKKLPVAAGLARHWLSTSPLRFLLYMQRAMKKLRRRRKQSTTAAATMLGTRAVSVEIQVGVRRRW